MSNSGKLNPAFRIIDASFNRAMEGLRVVEEFARMHLNDSYLSEKSKKLRHDLNAVVSQIGGLRLIECRDIENDVGTQIGTESEYARTSMLEITRANFGRVLQSLRSMEEYSKLVAPETSKSFESLRYETYSLEKAMVGVETSLRLIGDANIYVLIDTCSSVEAFERLINELVEAKVDFIQLRDKRLDDRELVEAGQLLSRLTRPTSTRWIMNDRADLAAVTDADGVHLGQTDISVAAGRSIVGAEKIVGVSTHNVEQAEQAVVDGADYIGVGPCFESKTKTFESFAADDFVAAVADRISLPAFAIGGIDSDNIEHLLGLGVTRFAIGNAIAGATSPASAVEAIRNKVTNHVAIG